jgi:hypothetical protein
MGTISKLPLSGSSQGKAIQVAATSSPGTTIHATGTSATVVDEIWLYCTNNDSVPRNITIEYGSTGATNQITLPIPFKNGLTVLIPGLLVTGDGTQSTTVTAFASAANVISVHGYINRIVQ